MKDISRKVRASTRMLEEPRTGVAWGVHELSSSLKNGDGQTLPEIYLLVFPAMGGGRCMGFRVELELCSVLQFSVSLII